MYCITFRSRKVIPQLFLTVYTFFFIILVQTGHPMKFLEYLVESRNKKFKNKTHMIKVKI